MSPGERIPATGVRSIRSLRYWPDPTRLGLYSTVDVLGPIAAALAGATKVDCWEGVDEEFLPLYRRRMPPGSPYTEWRISQMARYLEELDGLA